MKIVIIQPEPPHEAIVTNSLTIGLQKKYPKSKIIWVGSPDFIELIKFNRRVAQYINYQDDIGFDTLQKLHGADVCINPCSRKKCIEIAALCNAKAYYGFTKQGPSNREAEFFSNVMKSTVKTNKTILDLYYNLAGLKWNGEGYAISYFPKNKQVRSCGINSQHVPEISDPCDKFKLPKKVLSTLDVINRYAEIHTDNHLTLHASMALRKKVTFYSPPLPYKIEFFNNGKQVEI